MLNNDLHIDGPKTVIVEKTNNGLDILLKNLYRPKLETLTYPFGDDFIILQYSKELADKEFGKNNSIIIARAFIVNHKTIERNVKIDFNDDALTHMTNPITFTKNGMSYTGLYAIPDTGKYEFIKSTLRAKYKYETRKVKLDISKLSSKMPMLIAAYNFFNGHYGDYKNDPINSLLDFKYKTFYNCDINSSIKIDSFRKTVREWNRKQISKSKRKK